MINLGLEIVRLRVVRLEEESIELISECRKVLREARLEKAKKFPQPRCTFMWSRWSNKVTRLWEA